MDADGRSEFHQAVARNDIKLVKELLSHDNCITKDLSQWTALHSAASIGNEEIVELICSAIDWSIPIKVVQIDTSKIPNVIIDKFSTSKNTKSTDSSSTESELIKRPDYPKFELCSEVYDYLHSSDEVKEISALDFHVNYRGESPLHCATRKGHHTIVNILLSVGFDINQSINGMSSPLVDACALDRKSILELFSSYDPDWLTVYEGSSLMHVAAENHAWHAVAHLYLELPELVDALDSKKRKPIEVLMDRPSRLAFKAATKVE